MLPEETQLFSGLCRGAKKEIWNNETHTVSSVSCKELVRYWNGVKHMLGPAPNVL